nr:hypothetical protein [Tanacetum cinerariifolium]
MLPEKLEDPYVEVALQAPPSPDYDQPYAEDASPIAQSPDYVLEFDFEAHPEDDDDEDPEEDPVDYPTNGGDDGDDEKESSEDEEDDEMDVEADEEEEHSAPADSVVVAPTATDQAPSAEETESFKTDELRYEIASTSSPPSQLPSASRREDRPEVTLPPRKRLDIALGPRYEVGESSSTAAARPAGGFRADYGFVAAVNRDIMRDPEREVGYGITDSWDEIVETLQGAPVSTDTELGGYVREFETRVRQDTYEIYMRLDDEQTERKLLAGRLNMLFRDRPPAPPPSPIRSLGYRAAMIRLRDEAASTSPPPSQLLSTSRSEDRPEVTLPPRKRLGIAFGPRYEIGESSSAAAARPAGGFRADYGFVAAVDREIMRNIMAEGEIDNLTIEQYLALNRGNQAPGVVKPEIGGNEHDTVMLRIFPITLTEDAKMWVDRLSLGTVDSWDLLKKVFIQRYCPPFKTTKQLEEIRNFKNIDSSSNSEGSTAIVSKLDSLGRDMKKLNENVHAIQLGCQTYGGAHLDRECPLNKEVTSVKEVKYSEFGRPSLFSNGAKYRVGPPGYYTRIDNRLPFGEKRKSLEEP